MQKSGVWFRRLAAIALGGGLLCTYLATIAPGLTWANGGADGGDLIAAAATGGVAHPTGYPVYLLFARLFQFLPVGSLAFRTNLLSAIATVAAAILLSEIVRESVRPVGEVGSVFAGLVAGISFGLAPLVWSQAVITEVYALHVFFIALLFYLCIVPKTRSSIRNYGIGLTAGLAAGNHILALLMAPAVLAVISLTRVSAEAPQSRTWAGWQWHPRALAAGTVGILTGLLSYAVLPLRAAQHPPVNWGVPVTLQRLGWLVSGSLYQDSLIQFNANTFWTHLQAWAALTVRQTGILGLVLALLGLVVFFTPSKIHFLTLWAALVFAAFSVQYAVEDSYVHLLPVYFALSIGIGVGVLQLARLVSRYFAPASWLIAVLALMYFVPFGLGHWGQVDASHDWRAEAIGRQLLDQSPPRAILFAQGDRTVFSLWYFHYALGERPDLAVIANDLLPFDWYRENLRYTYPDLIIPEPTEYPWLLTIRRANAKRPACYASYPENALNCE